MHRLNSCDSCIDSLSCLLYSLSPGYATFILAGQLKRSEKFWKGHFYSSKLACNWWLLEHGFSFLHSRASLRGQISPPCWAPEVCTESCACVYVSPTHYCLLETGRNYRSLRWFPSRACHLLPCKKCSTEFLCRRRSSRLCTLFLPSQNWCLWALQAEIVRNTSFSWESPFFWSSLWLCSG